MKLIHLADLHLGFRQFDRLAPTGVNQREVDVAKTTSRAMRQVIAERPDVVVIGGDVFHQTRPSNPAIVHAFTCFAQLREALPNCEVVIVAGNHDAPRTADAGCILQLFRSLNFRVVERAVEDVSIPSMDLYIMAVPDVVGLQRPALIPNATAAAHSHRVLLMHGEIAGVLRVRTSHDIDAMDLHAESWDYVALGHYHVYREVAPKAYYSGSLDYVSSDPWGEMREQRERNIPGKGFVVQDLATGAHRFVPTMLTRQFLDLTPINCEGLTTSDINDAIAIAVETASPSIDSAVVRLVLQNCTRAMARELNTGALREYRNRALHFQLDIRKPEATTVALRLGTPSARRTASDVVQEYFTSCDIPADIQRDELVTTAVAHMRAVDDKATHAPQLVEI